MTDPFSAAILDILDIYEKKNADYAAKEDRFSNFREMGLMLNISPRRAADMLEVCKLSRLRALEHNGTGPANEAVIDSYRDKATYAVLAYAMAIEEARNAP